MGTVKNIGYNGGSPRIRYDHKITKSPKIYDIADAKKLISVIEQQFLKNTISIQELKFMTNRFKTINEGKNMMGAQELTPGIVTNKFIDAVENLYSDEKINKTYLEYLIEGLSNIDLYPIKPEVKDDVVNTEIISNFTTLESKNIRTKKVKKVVNKLVKAEEVKSIIDKLKSDYSDRRYSKIELDNFKMYLHKLRYNTPATYPPLPFFLTKTYEFINNLYVNEKLNNTQLDYLLQQVELILSTQLPDLPKEEPIKPKEKINNLSIGYNK
jgi:hypothetical protein